MSSGNQNLLRVRCSNCDGTFLSAIGASSDETYLDCNYEDCPYCRHTNKGPTGLLRELKASEPDHSQPRTLYYLNAKPYFYHKPAELLNGVKTGELLETIASFNSNIGRLHSMLELPVNVAWISRLYERFEQDEREEMRQGGVNPDDEDSKGKIVNGVSSRFVLWNSSNKPAQRLKFIEQNGEPVIANLTGGAIWLGMEANLIAQTTGMWTAFEALASDLWEAALNAHPFGLAELKGKTLKEIDKNDQSKIAPDQRKANDKKSERWLMVRSLLENKYDLSKCMGTALKHRFNFTVLEGIREAYLRAFDKNRTQIVDAITHQSLDTLCAVRNVFVHKAGIADEEFIEDVKTFPLLSGFQKHKRIPIDGNLISSLVEPVLNQCVSLINAVDTWISGQPERKDNDIP